MMRNKIIEKKIQNESKDELICSLKNHVEKWKRWTKIAKKVLRVITEIIIPVTAYLLGAGFS